jgi:uncharacterized protein (UPF0276 family)
MPDVGRVLDSRMPGHDAPTAGLGLRPPHYADAAEAAATGLWFEVHSENYMVDGGPRLAWLETIRTRHPLSLHGVGLSLGSDVPPDSEHLARLNRLVERFEPFIVSEHLAWSTWNGVYNPDLLPVPRSFAALRRVAENVQRVQDAIKRQILVENPSHYLQMSHHEYGEIEFLTELSGRTGCRLLLDVNNIYVSANNLGFDANAYVDAFPGQCVSEVHLAGHGPDPILGGALLIDSHDAPVSAAVWRLYARLIARIGPRPTLIERDDALPPFEALLAERNRAECVLRTRAMCR